MVEHFLCVFEVLSSDSTSMPGLPVEPKQYGHKVFCDIWAGLLQCAVCCTQNYQEGCVEHRFLDLPPTACELAKLQCAQDSHFS